MVDRDLVEQARRGDREAFAVLVHQVSDCTALLAILTLAAVTTTVSATPPSGQTPSGLAVGRLSDPIHVNVDRINFDSNQPTDVATFTVTYDSGGFSGWHTHP